MDSQRKFHKVPQILRQEECNHGEYDPKVVSLGPYHHGKQELELCQQAKAIALDIFLDGSGKTRDFFFSKVMEMVADARGCYVDGSTYEYSNEDFAEMMLLDGCFIIYWTLALMGSHDRVNKAWYYLVYKPLGSLVRSLIIRDIFLMENQIPFFVVTMLIESRYNEAGRETLRKFLQQIVLGEYKQQTEHDDHVVDDQMKKPPLHLLQAFRRVLVWDQIPKSQQHDIIVKDDEKRYVDFKKLQITFRSVKDLKAKGIYFRPSPRKSLKAISFGSFGFYCRQLQLPITWFDSNLSKVFFLNMIAYEICPDSFVDNTVSSYVAFMKSLIDGPSDVKELREKRILLSMGLRSDEEVVKLFRDLKTYGTNSVFSYQDVKEKIQRHYDSKSKTWIAELIHKYLSTPWAVIALIAASLIIVLAFLQTYFTINPKKE